MPLLTEIMLQLVSHLSAAVVAFLHTGPILKIVVSISDFNGKRWENQVPGWKNIKFTPQQQLKNKQSEPKVSLL